MSLIPVIKRLMEKSDNSKDIKEMRILAMRLAFLALRLAYRRYKKRSKKK